MSRLTSTLKQNPVREPPPTSSSCSSHFLPLSRFPFSHSFILYLLSSKVVALFHSLPWARGEQCKHTLLPWIRVRNPIRPSYSSYSFLFFLSQSCQGKGTGGGGLAAKANPSLFSLFFFFPPSLLFFLLCFCVHALTCTSFSCVSIVILPMVSFLNQ